jgi:hypothetical protein
MSADATWYMATPSWFKVGSDAAHLHQRQAEITIASSRSHPPALMNDAIVDEQIASR